jgi:hypothetical protein
MNDKHANSAANWPALVVAWTVVGIPTLWGVTQTIMKSLALFR